VRRSPKGAKGGSPAEAWRRRRPPLGEMANGRGIGRNPSCRSAFDSRRRWCRSGGAGFHTGPSRAARQDVVCSGRPRCDEQYESVFAQRLRAFGSRAGVETGPSARPARWSGSPAEPSAFLESEEGACRTVQGFYFRAGPHSAVLSVTRSLSPGAAQATRRLASTANASRLTLARTFMCRSLRRLRCPHRGQPYPGARTAIAPVCSRR